MWKAEPPPPPGSPQLAILAAMGIAIAGAVVSVVFDVWLIVLNPGYAALLSLEFLILNLILVALNIWFLVGMWHQEEWAWRAAFALVVMGAALDFFGVISPFIPWGDFGLVYLGWIPAPIIDWVANLVPFWNWVHLVVIQVPILALLWLTPSRRWVGIETPIDRLHDRVSRS